MDLEIADKFLLILFTSTILMGILSNVLMKFKNNQISRKKRGYVKENVNDNN